MSHYLYRNQDALILIPIQVQTKINIELRKYRPQVELVAQPFDGKRHPTRHQCCGSQRSNYRWSAIAQIAASRRECCQQITWHFVVHIFLWWFCVFHAQYSYCHVLHGIRIGHDNRFCRCVLFFSFVICNCLSPHRRMRWEEERERKQQYYWWWRCWRRRRVKKKILSRNVRLSHRQ